MRLSFSSVALSLALEGLACSDAGSFIGSFVCSPTARATLIGRRHPPLLAQLATVDVLSHIIGHYNSTNLGIEMVIELLSISFWYTDDRSRRGRAQSWTHGGADVWHLSKISA